MTEADDFRDRFNVSRETVSLLETYETLLRKWNSSINLVSKGTIEHTWHRHFSDSAAVFELIRAKDGKWLDLGTGAGFPGAVNAILASHSDIQVSQTCIEADIRKCEFLRTIFRATKVTANVISRRIEDTPAQNAQVITARALSSLSTLCAYAEKHLAPEGICVFHKGQNWIEEVAEAEKYWSFEMTCHENKCSEGSVLLEISGLQRV